MPFAQPFSEVVLLLYREVHCLMFAIEIVDTKGYSRVVLNPAAYVIPDTSPKVCRTSKGCVVFVGLNLIPCA